MEVPIPPTDEGRAVSWVARGRTPIAAIVYDADLADQARFIQAAGNVALLHLDNARLKASLLASNREIAASRIRLVEAAKVDLSTSFFQKLSKGADFPEDLFAEK